jgi:hypothetical protein
VSDETFKAAEMRVAAYNELTAEQGRALYAEIVRRGLELSRLRAENAALQANLAAMRLALEMVKRGGINPVAHDKCLCTVCKALAPDAGAAFLERMRRLEAAAEEARQALKVLLRQQGGLVDENSNMVFSISGIICDLDAALDSLEGKNG